MSNLAETRIEERLRARAWRSRAFRFGADIKNRCTGEIDVRSERQIETTVRLGIWSCEARLDYQAIVKKSVGLELSELTYKVWPSATPGDTGNF